MAEPSGFRTSGMTPLFVLERVEMTVWPLAVCLVAVPHLSYLHRSGVLSNKGWNGPG